MVAIEADPVQAENARQMFKNYLQEGRLNILNVGVAEKEGQFDFFINEKNPEWNSFDLAIASRDGLPWHSISINALPFDKIIRQHGVPYYLKVDIEGHDYLCIRGLDPDNLPKFISVEANDIGLLSELAEKGFTKFKLIFQYNLAHLDLPENKYFSCWLLSYRMRQWDSFPAKVFRKLGGTRFIRWMDNKAIPGYAKNFKPGTSGNFGENLGGNWNSFEKTKEIFQYYHNIFHNLPNKKDYGFWVDIHATR